MFKRLWLPVLVWMAPLARPFGSIRGPGLRSRPRSLSQWPRRAAFIDQYCTGCHGSELPFADLDLQSLDLTDVGEHGEILEKVVMKLRGSAMPPAGMPRAAQASVDSMVRWLEASLDQVGAARPRPWPSRTLSSQPN